VVALLLGLAQTRVSAQDYYGQAPVPPTQETEGQYTSASYNAMLMELETRLAALEDKEKEEEKEDACKEIDIQTKPSHKFRGRMFFDQIWANDLRGPGGAEFPLENTTGFDTIRLGVSGNIYENFRYSVEFEFEGTAVDYKTIIGELTDMPGIGNLRAGFFKEPLGLEQLTSSRHITFMERSTPSVLFTPARNFGIQAYNHFGDNENVSWYAGLFRGSTDDDASPVVRRDSNDWSFTGRIAALPYYDEATPGRCLLHVAGFYSHRRLGRDEDGNASRSGNGDWEPFLELDGYDGPSDVTLPFGSEFDLVGYELAYMRGPFHIQNETFCVPTNSIPGLGAGSDFTVWGTYIEVGYFLTGENRGYKKGGKAFDRVKPLEPFFFVRTADGPAAGLGAWQIAARWSYTDIGDATFDDPFRQENIALGLNWYLNPYSRVMLNWVHSISDYVDPTAAPPGPGKFEGDHLGMRFQFDW
jgi:phosphate-selective porin OprO/OprP